MTDWWNKNSEQRINDFMGWVGTYDQETKALCRKYVSEKGYESIIDCGCGLATEYYGYKNDNYNIKYTGLDSCVFFVNTNKNCGIPMVEANLEDPLPLDDSSYDCVYCRDVLEHLKYYENTLNEFIRIGKKEVLIGWFIKPDENPDVIDYWAEEDLYHNKYNKNDLEKFLSNNLKVKSFYWTEVNDKENVLHILLK